VGYLSDIQISQFLVVCKFKNNDINPRTSPTFFVQTY
jgi:hypothetical protein